jgi:hypothetical protein
MRGPVFRRIIVESGYDLEFEGDHRAILKSANESLANF